ncbi:MAG: FkbM family methyltransferase [Magnetococcales bacterium]|nr:FkbM family methyltransferase [Magnetococcales bacterium]MBF0322432.1 FkbM family methyltransferase [Magnetococcales bacterium]
MISNIATVLRHRGPAGLARVVLNGLQILVQGRLLGERFLEKPIYNYRMFLDTQDRGISRTLLLFGSRELDHKIILEEVLKPGMTVFDIGANIGYYVLMEQGLIGPQGRIVAIEPSPANAELLKKNLALNGCPQVTLLACAVSDRHDRQTFHLAAQSNLNTFHPVGSGTTHLTGKTIDVETITVPELLPEHGAPDLIRMDVEGHEVEVINGLVDAVEAGKMAPMIVFETHLTRYTPDHDLEKPLRRLFACGYGVPMAASSSAAGTAKVEARGYRGGEPIHTDFLTRVIFRDIKPDDAIEFICHSGGLRTVLLQKITAP